MKWAWRGEKHLVQMRRQPDAGGILHGVHSASLLVVECLHPAQIVQSRRGRTATRKTGSDNSAVIGDADRRDIGMYLRTCVRLVKELLAERIGHRRTGESLVEQDRTIRYCIIKFLPCRMPMLLPLIGMPASH